MSRDRRGHAFGARRVRVADAPLMSEGPTGLAPDACACGAVHLGTVDLAWRDGPRHYHTRAFCHLGDEEITRNRR